MRDTGETLSGWQRLTRVGAALIFALLLTRDQYGGEWFNFDNVYAADWGGRAVLGLFVATLFWGAVSVVRWVLAGFGIANEQKDKRTFISKSPSFLMKTAKDWRVWGVLLLVVGPIVAAEAGLLPASVADSVAETAIVGGFAGAGVCVLIFGWDGLARALWRRKPSTEKS